MLKFVKALAVVGALAGAVAIAPTAAQAQHWHGHGHGGGWGWGAGAFGLGLGLGMAAPYGYYGGPYYGGPYAYAGNCGWVRIHTYYGWRRAWRCW